MAETRPTPEQMRESATSVVLMFADILNAHLVLAAHLNTDPVALAGRLDLVEMVETLRWYERQTRDCRKLHGEGEDARQALDKDGGENARTILARLGGEG